MTDKIREAARELAAAQHAYSWLRYLYRDTPGGPSSPQPTID